MTPDREAYQDAVRDLVTGPASVAAKGEHVAELAISSGGLMAKVRIPLNQETRCTISPDGTMACTLPSGAQWTTRPLRE